MYILKWYKPKEVFPPEIASPIDGKFDQRNWLRFDDRILFMADRLREDFGIMTGNEGTLTECGFRFPTKDLDIRAGHKVLQYSGYNFDTLSQHCFGRALDLHPKESTVFEIRKAIIKNPGRYPHITFLEVDRSWLHIDCGNRNKPGGMAQLWSPEREFVGYNEYLQWGDN